MKYKKLLFNELLRRYNKCRNRLANLAGSGRNARRQGILEKRIASLYEKLMNLQRFIKLRTAVAATAFALFAFQPEAKAQTPNFGAAQQNPFGLAAFDFYSSYSSTSFADLDNDGDLDMLSGSHYYYYNYSTNNTYTGGNFHYYENTGSNAAPAFAPDVQNPFGLTGIYSGGFDQAKPVFIDMDGDGDLDIMSGNWDGDFYYYKNTGTASAPAFDPAQTNPFNLAGIGGTTHLSSPSFVDIDGDGDFDMVSGAEDGNFYYFENNGSVTAPSFAGSVMNPFSLTIPYSYPTYSAPTFTDLDQDGDMDMISGDNNGNFNYFVNSGTSTAPDFSTTASQNPFNLTPGYSDLSPTFVDLDNDGLMDIMTGDEFGTFNFYRNIPTLSPGAALNFDGVNDYVAVSSAALNNLGMTNITMEAWVNSADNSSVSSIIRKTGDYNLYLNNGVLTAEVWPTGTGNPMTVYTGATVIPTNTWAHVAFSWDNSTSTAALYVNGVAETMTSNSGAVAGNDALQLGASATYNQFFTGSMDEVRIWNRTVCQAEIQNNMNAELPMPQAGLVAYYQMNEGQAGGSNPTVTTVTDASTSSASGTATSFALSGTTSNWVAPGAVTSGSLAPLTASVSVSAPVAICAGSSATLTASGANTYTWTAGPNTATYTVMPTLTSTYSVTGTDNAGCLLRMATTTVTVNSIPTVTVNSGTICAGQPFTMVPGGATTYTYSSGTAVVSPTSTASYTVTGASNSCTATAVNTVSVNPLPTVAFSMSPTSFCTTSPTVALSGATPAGGTFSGTGVSSGNFDPGAAGAGTYTLTYMYTDANSCANTATSTVNVSVCTGIDAISNNTGFSVYPNPNKGVFTISASNVAENVTLVIYNSVGQAVYSQLLSKSVETVSPTLAAGMYIVKLQSTQGISTQRLVIEQ